MECLLKRQSRLNYFRDSKDNQVSIREVEIRPACICCPSVRGCNEALEVLVDGNVFRTVLKPMTSVVTEANALPFGKEGPYADVSALSQTWDEVSRRVLEIKN
jgi:hypothetical protein